MRIFGIPIQSEQAVNPMSTIAIAKQNGELVGRFDAFVSRSFSPYVYPNGIYDKLNQNGAWISHVELEAPYLHKGIGVYAWALGVVGLLKSQSDLTKVFYGGLRVQLLA